MKEFILTVQKLRIAHTAYADDPSEKNYFKMLDLDAIVEFMAGYLLAEQEAQDKAIFPPIFSN